MVRTDAKIPLTDVTDTASAQLLHAQARQLEPLQSYQQGSITTPEAAELASERLILVRTVADAFEEARKKLKAPHLQAGQKIDSAFKPFLDRCKNLDGSIAGEILRYKQLEAAKAYEAEQAAKKAQRQAERAQAKQRDEVTATAQKQAADMGLEGEDAEAWVAMAQSARDCNVTPTPAAVKEALAIIPPSKKIHTDLGAAQVTKGAWVYDLVTTDEVPAVFWRLDPAKVVPDVMVWIKLMQKPVPQPWRRLDHDAVKAAIAAGVREIPGLRIYQQDVLRRA